METIGKVSCIRNERDFEWRIEDFCALSTEVDNRYHSPVFYFTNASWFLRIYTNGEKVHESVGYIGVYLMKEPSGPPIKLDFSLKLKTMDQKTDREMHYSDVFEKPPKNGWGRSKFLKRSEYLESRSKLGLPEVLTIICTMKYLESTGEAIVEKLSQNLKEMMLSGDNRDIIVKVKAEEFPLHRDVLAARNSFFSAMFKSDMKEQNTGVVSIDDCEPDIFRNFALFIYTGKVDKLSLENVGELYVTSDKYQEDQLKEMCLDFMMKTISEDSFFEFITLALKYDEKKLFEKAVDFLLSKPKELVRSVKWQDFAKEYPTQAYELIIKTLDHHVK